MENDFEINLKKNLNKYLKVPIIHREENFEKNTLESTNGSQIKHVL